MQVNYGSGDFKLPDCINIDMNVETNPDLVCDLKTSDFPFKDASTETIYAMHILEHIEVKFWDHIFEEFRRILQDEGSLIIAYPEFEVCAKYFVENYRGNRDFWRGTLFGRQLYPGDYHVVPMRTAEVIKFLESYGFNHIKFGPAELEEWSTFVSCKKGPKFPVKEDILRKEIFASN